MSWASNTFIPVLIRLIIVLVVLVFGVLAARTSVQGLEGFVLIGGARLSPPRAPGCSLLLLFHFGFGEEEGGDGGEEAGLGGLGGSGLGLRLITKCVC